MVEGGKDKAAFNEIDEKVFILIYYIIFNFSFAFTLDYNLLDVYTNKSLNVLVGRQNIEVILYINTFKNEASFSVRFSKYKFIPNPGFDLTDKKKHINSGGS